MRSNSAAGFRRDRPFKAHSQTVMTRHPAVRNCTSASASISRLRLIFLRQKSTLVAGHVKR